MPHFTLQISPHGPILEALVSISSARLAAIKRAGKQPPPPIPVRALLDTGASCTCIEPSILQALNLEPRGQTSAFTPSSGAKPVACFQYDVGLVIPSGGVAFVTHNLLVIEAVADSLHPQGIQALIGRDILKHCLLNYNGVVDFFTLAY